MKCQCSGVKNQHEVGNADCKREWIIPPRKINGDNDLWLVTESEDGKQHKSLCTEFSLKQHRGYSQHEDGQWSRPKGGGSIMEYMLQWVKFYAKY